MLSGQFIVFFLLSMLIIGGAVFMISLTKVVHMVVSLSFTFLSLAGLYILLQAEFVAFVQILIYAGAVSILMIFGIMMTKHQSEEASPPWTLHNTLLGIGSLALFGILVFSIQQASFIPAPFDPGKDNTFAIGQLLYSKYVIPFELVSVLLTVAFIGAIVLAKREEEQH